MKKTDISIILPAYNEEKNIAISLDKVQHYVKRRGMRYEIIVVDDGSRDETSKIIKEEITRDPNIKLVAHEKNQGYGSTVYDGLKTAKNEFVFFMDSDLQFDISELDEFFKKIEKFDAVIGYRAPRRDPFMRLVNAWGWKTLVSIIFDLKIKDIDCAFKLFRKSALENINVKSRGAMFSAELIIRIISKRKRIAQLPVSHYKRVAGKPTGAKPVVILRAFKELFSLRKELKRELSQIDECDRIIS